MIQINTFNGCIPKTRKRKELQYGITMENPVAIMRNSDKGYTKYWQLYDWRNRVASLKGPINPVMRHVLLTLSLNMDEKCYCFPSIKYLAERTGSTEKTVGKHLKNAVQLGWIKRRRRGVNGQAWQHYEYWGTYPQRDVADTAPLIQRAVIEGKTSGNPLQKVQYEIPTNSSSNNSKTDHESKDIQNSDKSKTIEKLSDEKKEKGISNCQIILSRLKSGMNEKIL